LWKQLICGASARDIQLQHGSAGQQAEAGGSVVDKTILFAQGLLLSIPPYILNAITCRVEVWCTINAKQNACVSAQSDVMVMQRDTCACGHRRQHTDSPVWVYMSLMVAKVL
jgi:hypothetical protein